jgi:hypothetical protein
LPPDCPPHCQSGGPLPGTDPEQHTVKLAGDETTDNVLWNVLFALPVEWLIVPYAGGGVGVGGYQLIVGADLGIFDDLYFETRYSFLEGDDKNHLFSAVLTYYFDDWGFE